VDSASLPPDRACERVDIDPDALTSLMPPDSMLVADDPGTTHHQSWDDAGDV
jgi:hypothetical protein